MPPKKVPFNPFKSRARARSLEPPATIREEDIGQGEFRDTAISFVPGLARTDAALTLQFRCTVRLARGDTISFKLAGFKGPQATVFCLEPRPHPEGKDFRDSFHAYWSGESPPKGGPPAQSVILCVRRSIEVNTLVIVGVPDAVHVTIPDKLALNSAKLKIDGMVRHSNGPGPVGKIAKTPVLSTPEVKKRSLLQLNDDFTALKDIVKDVIDDPQVQLEEEEVQIACEVTQPDADQVWEAVRDLSELTLGMPFRYETTLCTEYKTFQPLNAMIVEAYKAATKKRSTSLVLHRELAKNLDVKIGDIVMLEDALFLLHGSQYAELSRAAILVLRLWTCEANDLARILRIPTLLSIQREVMSGMRTMNEEVLRKWPVFIGTLMTCCSTLPVETGHVPPLFRGVKDLPQDVFQTAASLATGSTVIMPSFTQYVAEANFKDENFSAPDNAVVFEVQGATNGVELGDISQYPEDKDWLLPMFTSFTVLSVTPQPERNGMLHIVLRMRGSLSRYLPDDNSFPREECSQASTLIKNAKTNSVLLGVRSHAIARLAYANLRMIDLQMGHPDHTVHAKYLEKFADVKRASVAKQQIDEGVLKWKMSNVAFNPAQPENPRQILWEPMGKKQASILEALFLKRTRATKVFDAEGVHADFTQWICDLGKGPRLIRRYVGSFPTHPFAS